MMSGVGNGGSAGKALAGTVGSGVGGSGANTAHCCAQVAGVAGSGLRAQLPAIAIAWVKLPTDGVGATGDAQAKAATPTCRSNHSITVTASIRRVAGARRSAANRQRR